MSRLERILETFEYDRPWVGRVGLVLGLILWAVVSVAAFAAGLGTGLALSIGGGAFILGTVWMERRGDRQPALAIAWDLAWHVGLGAVLIVIGVVDLDGWATAVAVVFGPWLLVSGLVGARLRWLALRAAETGGGA